MNDQFDTPAIDDVKHDTWDSWYFEQERKIHRYSLTVAKGTQVELRHEIAELKHFTSNDGGQSWLDHGIVVSKSSTPGEWPDLVIWSGCVVDVSSGGNSRYSMFLTGRSREDGNVQKIGLSESVDLYAWTKPKIIMDPHSEQFRNIGYDTSENDGVFSAFRDPFVFLNPLTNKYHMLFAAKVSGLSSSKPGLHAVIGHATSDSNFKNWQVLKPLLLPCDYRQLELPQLVLKDGLFYLFVSTKDKPEIENAKEAGAAWRGFVASDLEQNFLPVYQGKNQAFFDEADKMWDSSIYGWVSFIPKNSMSPGVYATGFFETYTEHSLTLSKMIKIIWHNGAPYLKLAKTSHQSLI